jgi:hypothetical protein
MSRRSQKSSVRPRRLMGPLLCVVVLLLGAMASASASPGADPAVSPAASSPGHAPVPYSAARTGCPANSESMCRAKNLRSGGQVAAVVGFSGCVGDAGGDFAVWADVAAVELGPLSYERQPSRGRPPAPSGVPERPCRW